METNSNTPRTDALINASRDNIMTARINKAFGLARTLERELADLSKQFDAYSNLAEATRGLLATENARLRAALELFKDTDFDDALGNPVVAALAGGAA